MSTQNLGRKLASIVLGIILCSLIIGGVRQFLLHRRLGLRLSEREKRLSQLKEENRALQARLEEVKSLKFVDEQAQKLLGVRSATALPLSSSSSSLTEETKETEKIAAENYQKWLNLFFY